MRSARVEEDIKLGIFFLPINVGKEKLREKSPIRLLFVAAKIDKIIIYKINLNCIESFQKLPRNGLYFTMNTENFKFLIKNSTLANFDVPAFLKP